MKTEYEYLKMVTVPAPGKTSKWSVCNRRSGSELGEIKWYPAWRQYCYFPTVQAVYSQGCMDDISDFLKQLNKK
jgi:hypothetical protein